MAKHKNQNRVRLIEEISGVLCTLYPTLHIVQTEPKITVRGVFPVRLEGIVLDYYLIEIEIPNDYPNSVPKVRELANRVPREVDYHVYYEGVLCLFLPDERWRYWGEGKDFRAFLEEPVNDFFLGQLYYERHGSFPFGERRHVVQGIYDYYAEELGTSNATATERCISYLTKKKIKGHWKCYCGSGKKLRYCHKDKMWELHGKISSRTAKLTLWRLLEAQRNAKVEQKRQEIAFRTKLELMLNYLRFGRS
jgi:hypothetical protein